MDNYVQGYGSSTAQLMIVGEAPGKHEVEQGRPFVGPSGDLLNQALDYAGISRHDCYITNVVKIRPPNNVIDDLKLIGHSIEEFLPQLWDEIVAINPNCILAFGNTALTALTGFKGIKKYRGSIVQCKAGHKVVAAEHPASLMPHGSTSAMTQWKEFAWIKQDVKRAVEQSKFKEYRPPVRQLQVAGNSSEVLRFLETYHKCDRATIDVETNKTIAQCVGIAFNDYHAMSIPLFGDDFPDHDIAYTWRLVAEFFQDTKIKLMAQNAKFDEKRCRQIGLKWWDCWFDMAMGWHMLFSEFPKKLEFISSVITEEPYYKDEGHEFNKGKGKEANLRQWYLYNAKDAVVEFECCEKIIAQLKEENLYDLFFDKVMPFHRLYSDMEDVGILIDSTVRKHLRTKYADLRSKKQAELLDLISDGSSTAREEWKNFNVMSNGMRGQVAKLLYGYLKLPLRKDTGDDTLKSLANNVVKSPRVKSILMGVLEARKIRKTIGTYLDAEPSPQDITRFGSSVTILGNTSRMRNQTNVNGTETFRTSTQILKPPVSVLHEGIALQTMTKHEDVNLDAGGADLRSMFIADEGFTFIEPDSSQAEDRVVCVLAEDWQALKDYERKAFKFNTHGIKDDRHTLTSLYVCGLAFSAITDWERQIGKKTRHSGNYAVGKHQHMLTLAKSGIFVSEYKAGQQLERFHAENSRIAGVFWEGIQRALRDNNCVLYNPFGYKRIFFNKWGDELFKEAYAHIPQSTIPTQLKFAMVRIGQRLSKAFGRDCFYLAESHDSFLGLIRDNLVQDFAAITKEELEKPINFSKCSLSRDYDLVIPCEIKIGKRWVDKSAEFPDGMEKLKI